MANRGSGKCEGRLEGLGAVRLETKQFSLSDSQRDARVVAMFPEKREGNAPSPP